MKIPEEQLITAIKNCEMMDFGEFGKGCNSELIAKAEEKLGLVFPPSYKWWLKNYFSGNLGCDEVLGLYENYHKHSETENIAYPGDIVYNAFINLRNGDEFFSKNKLELLNVNGDEIFYFDTIQTVNKEWSVRLVGASYDENDSQPYAEDFSEFLYKLAISYSQ